jgi:hypothetical protein
MLSLKRLDLLVKQQTDDFINNLSSDGEHDGRIKRILEGYHNEEFSEILSISTKASRSQLLNANNVNLKWFRIIKGGSSIFSL